MSKVETNIHIIEYNNAPTQLAQGRPWIRFIARSIDLLPFSVLIGFFIGVIKIIVPDLPKTVVGFLMIFLWMFIEGFFLSTLGTTFGKWLLRIKVCDNNGKSLPFKKALKRSFLIWLTGLGIGIPLFGLFALIFAHRQLNKYGITTWDKKLNLVVTHQKIGVLRGTVASMLCSLMILSQFCLLVNKFL